MSDDNGLSWLFGESRPVTTPPQAAAPASPKHGIPLKDKPVSLGALMTGGARVLQRERNARDHYGTPPEATQALLRRHPVAGLTVWELCCAEGKIVDVLEEFGAQTIRSDIHPMCEGGYVADFLATTEVPGGVNAMVTNPPFNLAAEFIWHAHGLGVPFIAMLLKSTYWHAVRRRPLWEKHPPSHIHPLTWRLDFMNLGAPTMETQWVVWDARHTGPTTYEPLHRS